jgi:ABC-2 type transport system permease protein
MVLLTLFGEALSLEVKNLPVVVQDLDRSPLSRDYIAAYGASLKFVVVPLEVTEPPLEALDSGRARAAIVIPEGFDADLRRGASVEVQVLVDATDANTANLMRGNAVAISGAFLDAVKPEGSSQPAIAARTRLWFNPGRDTDKFIGPGVFAVILALFPPLLAALALSRESEQKTILQVYVSSITAHEYLLGKTLAFLAIALCQWTLALTISHFLYGIWFVGDPTPLLVGTVFYLFCSVAFGVMVGVKIPNQAAAIQAVQFGGFLFSFLLSGFLFPLANIPPAIRWVTALVPARYYIELARDAFVRGGGWPAVWHAPLMLAVLGAFFFIVAWRQMRPMQVDA